jgi:hypothetical protein
LAIALEAFSWAADAASIASLFVSVYVAWQVRGIKRRFVRRFALQTFIVQLGAHIKALSRHIGLAILNDVELSRAGAMPSEPPVGLALSGESCEAGC